MKSKAQSASKNQISGIKQNMIYAFILLIIGTFFYLVRPIYSYEPHGLFLPSSAQIYPAINSGDFSFLDSLPLKFTPVGNITVSTHFDSISPDAIDSILMAEKNFVQSIATKNGANAVVISMAGRSPGAPNVLDAVMLNATAIKI